MYRQAEREIQQLTARCSELESTQQQLISERDQALAEGLAQSKSVDSQQAQLSQQRMELMTERDQARNQLRVLQAELEKVSDRSFQPPPTPRRGFQGWKKRIYVGELGDFCGEG